MQPARILLPFHGMTLGGSHISSFTMAEVLQRQHGVQVHVAGVVGSQVVEDAQRRGFRTLSLKEKQTNRHAPLRELANLPSRIRQLAHLGKGTILHVNDMAALQSWGPTARLLGIPTVYHVRSLEKNHLANRFTVRFANELICISKGVLGNVGPMTRRPRQIIDNPFTITAPVSPAAIRKAFLDEFDLTDDGPLVGFIGNFWDRKRPVFFLEAAGELAKTRPDARFVIFGEDREYSTQDLGRIATGLGIGDRVIFPGFRLPVEANIAMLDLLAITALREPLGRTPIEAALLGVPYLGIDDAGIAEVCGRFGGGDLLPLDATPAAYAEAMDRSLSGCGARALGAEDRAALARQLSAENHAEQVLRIYDRLLAAH